MAMRKSGLFFISCVCMGHLVIYTNGEVTPPWITLLGCFDAEIGSQNIQLSNNNATNCFKACTTFNFVGIQKNTCICSKTFHAIEDVQNAARRSYTKCSMQDNRFMSLYTKVSSLPNTINQDADYGYVYVNISSSSSYEYHASKDLHESHYFICYDDSKQCSYRRYGLDRMESNSAFSQCDLVSYFDFVKCLNSTEFASGVFWIGMYRDSPDFISTLSTLSTRASTSTSTSTSTTTPQLTTVTPTPVTVATTDTPSITSLKVEAITPITLPLRTENITSTGNPNRTLTIGDAGNPSTTLTAENTDRKWTIIAAAFIAISVALVIAIIGVLVAFLRKKKDNQISHTDQENIIRPHSTSMPHTDQQGITRLASASTAHTDQTNEITEESASILHTDQTNGITEESAFILHTAQNNIRGMDSTSMPSGPRGEHSSRDGEINLNPENEGNHEEPLNQPPTNTKIAKHKRRRRKSHRREKHVNDMRDTAEENISDNGEKKRKRRKSHRREQTDANNLSDTAMENEHKIHRKKRKHRKRKSEVTVTDVSDTALEHRLLENLENDYRMRKERRENKNKKQKQVNTLEESDEINVS